LTEGLPDNLASAYQETGRAAEAIPPHERTLADTLASRNNLTAARASQG
jgi:hypothetical protein